MGGQSYRMSFMWVICTPWNVLFIDQINEDKIPGPCSPHGRDKKKSVKFWSENLKRRLWWVLVMAGRIMLRWIFREYGLQMRPGLIWLGIGSCCRLLWTQLVNRQVSFKIWSSSISQATIGLSRRTLLHGVGEDLFSLFLFVLTPTFCRFIICLCIRKPSLISLCTLTSTVTMISLCCLSQDACAELSFIGIRVQVV